MKNLKYYAAAATQVATHPVQVLKIEWTGAASGFAASMWLQVHDLATTPADGSVPIKSWPINSGTEGFKSFDVNELSLSNGLYICVSSAEATKTLSADTYSYLSVELTGPEYPTGTSTAGDLTTARASLQVWADAAGPKRLVAIWITSSSATDGYLQIHAADTPATAAIAAAPMTIAAGATKYFSFGMMGRDVLNVSGSTIRDGCTLAMSTTASTYTAWGSNEFTIKAEYK